MSGARALRTAAGRLARAHASSASAAAAGSCCSGAAAAAYPADGWQHCLGSPTAAPWLAGSALTPHGAARRYWAASAAAAAARGQAQARPAAAASTQRRWETSPTMAQHALVDRNLLVDTLETMKRFEGMGMSRQQSELLTTHITSMLCANKEKLADTYVAKAILEKSILEQEARIAGFRSEVLKSQELQSAQFLRDTERLQSNLEKIRSEIRYEVDKLTASQRLDMNLEKGRMRDELQMVRDKSNELEIKMDKEVNSLKAAMEQSKNDTVKYVLGLMLALMTAGLGAARLLMH